MKAGKVILIVVITIIVLFVVMYLIGRGTMAGYNAGISSTNNETKPAAPRLLSSSEIDELLNS